MKSPILINLDHNIIYLFINCLSLVINHQTSTNMILFENCTIILSFIISLVCVFLRKKHYNFKYKNKKVFNFEKNDEIKFLYSNKKEYFYVFILYLLLYSLEFLNDIGKMDFKSIYYNFIFLGIIIISYLRKEKLYEHHKLSYSIFFIMILILYFQEFIENKGYKLFIYFMNVLFSIYFYYAQGIINGYIKFSMEIKFIDPFIFILINNGVNLIKNFSVDIYYYISNKNDYFNKNWYICNKKINYPFAILSVISYMIYKIFDILVCYHYSPYHQCVCYVFIKMIDLIIRIIKTARYNLKEIITCIINIFFSCVVAEIIILNFCNLGKNTKYVINERMKISDSTINTLEDSSIEIQQNNSIDL